MSPIHRQMKQAYTQYQEQRNCTVARCSIQVRPVNAEIVTSPRLISLQPGRIEIPVAPMEHERLFRTTKAQRSWTAPNKLITKLLAG